MKHQRGVTLIETMAAILVGVAVISGSFALAKPIKQSVHAAALNVAVSQVRDEVRRMYAGREYRLISTTDLIARSTVIGKYDDGSGSKLTLYGNAGTVRENSYIPSPAFYGFGYGQPGDAFTIEIIGLTTADCVALVRGQFDEMVDIWMAGTKGGANLGKSARPETKLRLCSEKVMGTGLQLRITYN